MQTELEKVTIRKMTPDDIDSVIEIEAKSYGEHHWSKDSFLSEIRNDLARYFVLYNSENKMVGYAGTWHILEEAHITTIAVSPEYRKRNYGQALLKYIIDDCYNQKVKYITLEVRVSNEVAQSLYTKFGFTSFGTRKKYYQDNNEDALIMWTKNIFFDEFKNNYEKVIAELEGKIKINE